MADFKKTAQAIADGIGFGTQWEQAKELNLEGVLFHTEFHLTSFISKAELATMEFSPELFGEMLHEKVRRAMRKELGFDQELKELHEKLLESERRSHV